MYTNMQWQLAHKAQGSNISFQRKVAHGYSLKRKCAKVSKQIHIQSGIGLSCIDIYIWTVWILVYGSLTWLEIMTFYTVDLSTEFW